LPEGALIVAGLDQINGKEVGAFIVPKSAWPAQKQQIHVATRNCVDDAIIQENIKSNWQRIPKWIQVCSPHEGRIAFISAGPSLNGELDDVRALQANGAKVVCVKHAHDKLVEAGIIPWGVFCWIPEICWSVCREPHPKLYISPPAWCCEDTDHC
jgi:hypothetical protein